MTDHTVDTPFGNSPFKDEEGRPRLFVSGVLLTPREIQVEEMGGGGCGCLMTVIAVVAVALACGCRSYTVVAADREVVPVRQSNAIEGEVTRRTYVEAVEDATGWYVPDAVMLELLGAE